MTDQNQTTIVPCPPNFWGALSDQSHQSEIDACDANYNAWLASPAGELFLNTDRRVNAYANTHGCDYRAAMEALNVEFD